MTAYALLALLPLPLAAWFGWWLWRLRSRPRRRGRLAVRLPLAQAEQALYQRLCQALPQYAIFSETRLGSFLEVSGADKVWASRRQQELAGLSVDFLICNSQFQVIAAVLLDDVFRIGPGRERVAGLLREAGVPLLRWTSVNPPTVRDIQEAVAEVEMLRALKFTGSDRDGAGATHLAGVAGSRREPRL